MSRYLCQVIVFALSFVTNDFHLVVVFYGASKFNSDISLWDFSSVVDASSMFALASSFSKDLCMWGDNMFFPYDGAAGIFEQSGCAFQDDPKVALKGPFCGSDCL